MKKKVITIDYLGTTREEVFKTFDSAKEASEYYNAPYSSVKTACQDIGNCLIGDLAFLYEEDTYGLSEGDIIMKIKQARLKKLIFGK
jgi:hypothetical protein